MLGRLVPKTALTACRRGSRIPGLGRIHGHDTSARIRGRSAAIFGDAPITSASRTVVQGRCKTREVSEWGAATYGDPCRECGFAWRLATDEAVAIISSAPAAYSEVLRGASGYESAPELAWNLVGYVAHVADNLRIWGERLAAAAGPGDAVTLVSYDSDALAEARRYDSLPLSGVLWGLSEAVASWERAWSRADPARSFVHPDRGRIAAEDIARTNAHDVVHHQFDLRRCLASNGRADP